MTATNMYHVGVLVEDLDAAMARFGQVLGLTFPEPRTIHLSDLVEYGETVVRDLRVVYSNEGPPFLELIEAQDGGLWGHQHGEGLHHIGMWQDGLEARMAEMQAAGLPAEAVVTIDGTLIAAYLPPGPVHNTRIELVRRRQS